MNWLIVAVWLINGATLTWFPFKEIREFPVSPIDKAHLIAISFGLVSWLTGMLLFWLQYKGLLP